MLLYKLFDGEKVDDFRVAQVMLALCIETLCTVFLIRCSSFLVPIYALLFLTSQPSIFLLEMEKFSDVMDALQFLFLSIMPGYFMIY